MSTTLSLPLLVLVFIVAAAAVWFAGIQLSGTTDVIAARFKLGEALGGLILLALATNLPEIAIVVSGAVRHDVGLAVGNILGGIAVQTVVLVLLDSIGVRDGHPLSSSTTTLMLVLEATLVIAVMGSQIPDTVIFARLTPEDVLIAALWLVGLWLLNKARTGLPWSLSPDDNAPKRPREDAKGKDGAGGMSTARAIAIFAACAIVTLAAGVVLAESGSQIAGHIGLSGVLFGVTVLAMATSLPEISTGLASVKLGDYETAFSDIFGGNAFLPVLFLVATVISGQAVLPHAQGSDIYLDVLGILLTTVYIYGLIFRPQRRVLRMGVDSFLVLVLCALGIIGLVAVAHR